MSTGGIVATSSVLTTDRLIVCYRYVLFECTDLFSKIIITQIMKMKFMYYDHPSWRNSAGAF